MAKLSKEKVKSMLPHDIIVVACDNASELDSAYQVALQARNEMDEKGKNIAISKSTVTMVVVVRTGVNS